VSGATEQLKTALADRYVIERELGAGGMATVYLARDVKHEREVALKVLRPELAAVLGAERFLNEIRISARLDHPHILTLIDSGAADGFLYYVLPYVRGETLRDRLDREKQLALDEALTITRQVASALDYAHRQGVIHRDIKPENILFEEGEAVLADFGIALAVREAAGRRLTETGLSLGTPLYMSPEQATGDRQLDGRSDEYALAAVLYEMLAGDPPVTGPTAQAIVAKLLTERPTRLRNVRDTIPEPVEEAVARALARTPADRFESAGAFAEALGKPASAAPRAAAFGWRAVGLGAAATLGFVAVAFAAYRLLLHPAPTMTLGRSTQLTAAPGLEIQPAISPDGKLVAYAAGNAQRMRIYIRAVSGGRTFPLTDDSTAVETEPRWSPDGSSLLFLTRNGASVAPALGGSARPVIPGSPTAAVRSATWSPDGTEIAFVRGDSLQVARPDGTVERVLGTGYQLYSCAWSPGGHWIACADLNMNSEVPGTNFGNLAPSVIELIPAEGGTVLRLTEPTALNQSPVWWPDGRQLLFVSSRDGPRDVYAVDISASGQLRDQPRRLTTGLGALSISLSADGRQLAYAVYAARANVWSLPVPARGPITAAGAVQVTSGSQDIESMRVSHHDRWLIYDSNLHGNSHIYRIPLGGGQAEQLTDAPWDTFAGDLSPDGTLIAYHSWRTGNRNIEVKPLNGGPVERVTDTTRQESYPVWSPDGRSLAYFDQEEPYPLYVTRRLGGPRWSPPIQVAEHVYNPVWSPDGRWFAYVEGAAEDGNGPSPDAGIAIVPARGGAPRPVYVPGRGDPAPDEVQWDPGGRTLYFKAHDAEGRASFWSVPVAGGRPRPLVRFTDPDHQTNRRDFATDGKRFYFAIEDRESDVYVADLVPR
jgi:Tol biopolymer transport system component